MHDPATVQGLQGVAELDRDRNGKRGPEPVVVVPRRAHDRTDAGTGPLRDQGAAVSGGRLADQPLDIWMVEPGQDPMLSIEDLARVGLVEIAHHLDRDARVRWERGEHRRDHLRDAHDEIDLALDLADLPVVARRQSEYRGVVVERLPRGHDERTCEHATIDLEVAFGEAGADEWRPPALDMLGQPRFLVGQIDPLRTALATEREQLAAGFLAMTHPVVREDAACTVVVEIARDGLE